MEEGTMSEAWRRLGEAQYVSLATFRRDGREVRTPVWAAGDEGRLYVFSEGDAGKVKRIRATKRVAVAPCDVRGGLKGDFALGTGRVIDDAPTKDRAYRALRRKYGWQMTLLDLFSRLAGKIDKRALVELEASEGDG
jgi:PPOX class probable F420-dependent enzyme